MPELRTLRGSPRLLAAAVILAACGDAGTDLPVSIAYPAAAPPVSVEDGFTAYPTPAESLLVHDAPPPDHVELVFYRGRGVARDDEGRAYLPDPQASRVLVVGRDLTVEGVVGGPSEEGGELGQPLAAAPVAGGGLFVTDVEGEGGLLYFEDGRFVGEAAPPVPNADVRAGPGGWVWASRSPYVMRFDETPPGDPLLYRFNPLEGEGVGIAAIEPVAAEGWNRVANAGPVAVDARGVGYFAFFVRNEIRAYSPDGALLWRTTRTLDYDTYEPIFTGAGENLRYNMRPVTQALAVGPDGRLYALTVPDSLPDLNTLRTPAGHRRVEVYDPDTGALLRAAAVPADVTTFAVDGTGHVFRVDPDVIDTTAPAPERAPLPRVTLRTFDGDSATFQQYRGKALLVNFWASWCVPCQRELPELKAYYQTLDSDYVEFLAISADETPEIGRSFIEPFALPFPLFYGGAEMQERFHFIGLPYTLLVDARGRIVEEIYGFGSPETWQHLKDTLEGLIAEATPSGPAADHEHGETAADHGRGEPATDHGHGEVRPAAREP